ncbi:hypothetical protein [Albidovulum sp.]|uniref:hypothetical protein n=1 Tax=Albidovulum sp. TaxID=1872424 RepID=UPI0039B89E07
MISQADARLISKAGSLQATVRFIPQRTDQGVNAPEQHGTDEAMNDMTGTLGRLGGSRRRLSMPSLANGGGAPGLVGPLPLAVVLPWKISTTSAVLRFVVHRLMLSSIVTLIATFSFVA